MVGLYTETNIDFQQVNIRISYVYYNEMWK